MPNIVRQADKVALWLNICGYVIVILVASTKQKADTHINIQAIPNEEQTAVEDFMVKVEVGNRVEYENWAGRNIVRRMMRVTTHSGSLLLVSISMHTVARDLKIV